MKIYVDGKEQGGTPPLATTSSPGIVQVGSGLSVDSAGVLSASGGGGGGGGKNFVWWNNLAPARVTVKHSDGSTESAAQGVVYSDVVGIHWEGDDLLTMAYVCNGVNDPSTWNMARIVDGYLYTPFSISPSYGMPVTGLDVFDAKLLLDTSFVTTTDG